MVMKSTKAVEVRIQHVSTAEATATAAVALQGAARDTAAAAAAMHTERAMRCEVAAQKQTVSKNLQKSEHAHAKRKTQNAKRKVVTAVWVTVLEYASNRVVSVGSEKTVPVVGGGFASPKVSASWCVVVFTPVLSVTTTCVMRVENR